MTPASDIDSGPVRAPVPPYLSSAMAVSPPRPTETPELPRWRFESPCADIVELSRLYAPYWLGSSLYLFADDLFEVGTRAQLQLILAGGNEVLSCTVEVTETHDGKDAIYGAAGMRFAVTSIEHMDDALVEVMGRYDGETPPPIEGSCVQPPMTTRMVALTDFYRTQRMNAKDIAAILDPEFDARSHRLQCRVSIWSGAAVDEGPATSPWQTQRMDALIPFRETVLLPRQARDTDPAPTPTHAPEPPPPAAALIALPSVHTAVRRVRAEPLWLLPFVLAGLITLLRILATLGRSGT